MKRPGPSARRVLAYVMRRCWFAGYPPTVREIARDCCLAQSTVSYHIAVLKQFGMLAGEPGTPRTLHPVRGLVGLSAKGDIYFLVWNGVRHG